jgi:hypothetical protein
MGCGLLAGCGMPATDYSVPKGPAFAAASSPEEAKVMALTQDLIALNPAVVDPAEARRAAQIAVYEPLKWAQEWGVEDPPLLHNVKVNHGLKPRGLCKDWADDLQVAMWREKFQTIDLHRAIANSQNIKLEHSVLILTAKGGDMFDGIVLDPWRQGMGRLFWVDADNDPRYDWLPREEVFAWKREWKARVEANR